MDVYCTLSPLAMSQLLLQLGKKRLLPYLWMNKGVYISFPSSFVLCRLWWRCGVSSRRCWPEAPSSGRIQQAPPRPLGVDRRDPRIHLGLSTGSGGYWAGTHIPRTRIHQRKSMYMSWYMPKHNQMYREKNLPQLLNSVSLTMLTVEPFY